MNELARQPSARRELKERIIEAAGHLFAEHGIKSITMDDIATSFGISKRTLYEMFADKETLLIECIRREMEEELAYIQQLAESCNVLEILLKKYQRSIERFHATSRRFFEDIQKYPRAYEFLRNGNNRTTEDAVNFFREGVRQGFFRDDINFPIVNHLLRAQIDILMESDLCKTYPFLDVYEAIMFTFLRGISTPKGAVALDEFIHEYRKHTLMKNEE